MDGVSRTLSNVFDVTGNRTELTWMDGAKTSFAADPASRITAIYEGPLGSSVTMESFGYDGLGRRTSQTGRYGQATSFGYDPVSRLTTLTHDLSGTASDVNWSLAFNPVSQITSVARNNDSYAWTASYNVNRPYSVNGLNQYAVVGGAGFTYDVNGNLTSDGSAIFTYDIENRLVTASGGKTAGLRYDPLGRLYETTGTSGTTRFLYDGDELVAEFDGAGTLLRRYVHGTGVDDPVIWYEGSAIGSARWLHADNEGSIVGVTDASGASIATNRYDEYGVPQTDAATHTINLNAGRFQYTGQAWIGELAMYYYKARMYSPTLGRFMQTDPIGYKDQINLYAYVGDDPVNGRDPSGLYDCSSKEACAAAQEGISQIKAARSYYASPETGSNVPRNTAAATGLSGVLKDLGKKGDHNGLTIASGKPEGGARGDFNSATRTVTLNRAEIAASGGRIGETLAHEGEHDRLRSEFLPGSYVEARPLGIEYLVGLAPGGSLTGFNGGLRGYVVGRLTGYIGKYEHLGGPMGSQRANGIYNEEQWKPF